MPANTLTLSGVYIDAGKIRLASGKILAWDDLSPQHTPPCILYGAKTEVTIVLEAPDYLHGAEGAIWATYDRCANQINTNGGVTSTPNNGSVTVCLVDNVNPPTANAGADQTICLNGSIQIGGSPTASGGNGGPYSISWSPATGLSSATAANPTASPATTMTYTVTVTETSTGFFARDMVTVTVNALPVVTIDPIPAQCVGASVVTLSGSPAGGTFSGPGVSGNQFMPLTAGIGTHTITYSYSSSGCSNSASTQVTVTPCNLALNKSATASSSKPGHPPGLAVDGSTTTHWRSGTLSSGTNAWLRVDLGTTYSIDNVMINWPGSFFAKKYTVQISLTGAGGSWTTVYTDNTGNGGVDNITFAPQSGTRYVRVFMTQHNETVERINEFEVYAASGSLSKESEVAKSEVSEQLSVNSYQLEQNYPNPFNPSTTISFALPEASAVSLMIFNSMGQLVRTLVRGEYASGKYELVWDGKNEHGEQMASGMYLYVIKAGAFTAQRKLILMK